MLYMKWNAHSAGKIPISAKLTAFLWDKNWGCVFRENNSYLRKSALVSYVEIHHRFLAQLCAIWYWSCIVCLKETNQNYTWTLIEFLAQNWFGIWSNNNTENSVMNKWFCESCSILCCIWILHCYNCLCKWRRFSAAWTKLCHCYRNISTFNKQYIITVITWLSIIFRFITATLDVIAWAAKSI